ncbi:hypothetical protein [Risungbinella massiliensis]|uniref:hypothetical protein n=1 Tax=Risungbinella massiliensis TaxID=1329796 RepID=UPI0011CAD8C8|nr:hypothetical protein [Risungbinella massiliensis]
MVHAAPPDQVISIQEVEISYHQSNKIDLIKTPAPVQYEIQEILRNVYQLGGLTSIQLPSQYFQFHFSPAVVMPPISPIGHPIQEMIVSVPQTRFEPTRLYIRNTQNQWIEYRTTRSLSILLAQLQENITS